MWSPLMRAHRAGPVVWCPAAPAHVEPWRYVECRWVAKQCPLATKSRSDNEIGLLRATLRTLGMLREAKVEQAGISAVLQARNATRTQHAGPVSRKLFQEPTFGVKRPFNVAGPASSVLDQHLRCLTTGRIDGAGCRQRRARPSTSVQCLRRSQCIGLLNATGFGLQPRPSARIASSRRFGTCTRSMPAPS
jgi:hypothetical protein